MLFWNLMHDGLKVKIRNAYEFWSLKVQIGEKGPVGARGKLFERLKFDSNFSVNTKSL